MNKKSIKKELLVIALGIMTSMSVLAQEKASPARIATASVSGNAVTINYSSPSVKGRTIWGDLVPYDQVWRTGANEATTLEVSKDCTIGGEALKAGKYSLFTIPGKDTWTVIVNAEPKQWGAYKYDKSKDVLRFTTTPTSTDMTEKFTVSIDDAGKVLLNWDKVSVPFDIK